MKRIEGIYGVFHARKTRHNSLPDFLYGSRDDHRVVEINWLTCLLM